MRLIEELIKQQRGFVKMKKTRKYKFTGLNLVFGIIIISLVFYCNQFTTNNYFVLVNGFLFSLFSTMLYYPVDMILSPKRFIPNIQNAFLGYPATIFNAIICIVPAFFVTLILNYLLEQAKLPTISGWIGFNYVYLSFMLMLEISRMLLTNRAVELENQAIIEEFGN
jgi:hypothetical protein